ncbi:hypothetical protein [Amycolatopsis magusensis]|uniref:hypothetical protein n=1 Tax=Amycolatopsis magusensis TaxID=882444 RepID=UPI003C2D8946
MSRASGLVVTALTVAGVFGQATGASAGPAACEIGELPTPAGTVAATVDGATPDGRTLTGFAITGLDPVDGTAVLWRDGAISRTVEDAPSALLDLNSRGDGAGAANGHSWVYRDGVVQDLPGAGTATAIGESGQVVGSRLEPTPNGPPVAVPVVWAADGMTDLPRPGGQTGRALDIAADGTIVGELGVDAYTWRPDGTHGPLPRPAGVPPAGKAGAERITGPWVIGYAGGPVRWHLPDGTAEQVGELQFSVDAVNERGWMVGEGANPGALAIIDGQPVQLPPHPGLRGLRLVSISSDGTTFGGTAYDRPSMSERPVQWRCGP